MRHIIKKQIIDLHVDNRLDSFHIQELISRNYWKFIIPELQIGFDSISGDEETIQVDTLVIDLGVITENSLSKDKWIRELPAKLGKIMEGLRTPAYSGLSVVRNPLPYGVFRQWIFYMKNGYLHWSTLKTDEAWYQHVLGVLAADFECALELRNFIRNDREVLKRIVFQHNEDFLIHLVEILTAQRQDELRKYFKTTEIPVETGKSPPKLKAWSMANEGKRKKWIGILRDAADGSKPATGNLLKADEKFVPSDKITGRKSRDENSGLTRKSTGGDIADKTHGKDTDMPMREASLDAVMSQVNEDGIFVQNAGVVLLHPFLNNFFKRLGLVEEGKFKNIQSRNKALLLIHYLATSHANAEEYALVMAKVLCACPLEETVEREIRLLKREREEANVLLTATIQQWEILKHTSPDGLREGFLQRNGKLFTRNDNLYLQVEASSIDVLLDHLPWNLGMIKLPWMKGILSVEWR